jgi:hypothetical protein
VLWQAPCAREREREREGPKEKSGGGRKKSHLFQCPQIHLDCLNTLTDLTDWNRINLSTATSIIVNVSGTVVGDLHEHFSHPSNLRAAAPTAVIYVYAGTDSEYENNLHFFLREAVRVGTPTLLASILAKVFSLQLGVLGHINQGVNHCHQLVNQTQQVIMIHSDARWVECWQTYFRKEVTDPNFASLASFGCLFVPWIMDTLKRSAGGISNMLWLSMIKVRRQEHLRRDSVLVKYRTRALTVALCSTPWKQSL